MIDNNSFDMPKKEVEDAPIYDLVADMYEATFEDFTVRAREWEWITNKIKATSGAKSLLEIGCGNGAMMYRLAPYTVHAVGIDVSSRLLSYARKRNSNYLHINFIETTSSHIPIQDHSFDLVVSVLSWRYLNWQETAKEIKRLLKPGGKFLLVDMCRQSQKSFRFMRFAKEKTQFLLGVLRHPRHHKNLRSMVRSLEWKQLIQKNPAKTKDEYEQFFKTNFADINLEILSTGWNHEIVAITADHRS